MYVLKADFATQVKAIGSFGEDEYSHVFFGTPCERLQFEETKATSSIHRCHPPKLLFWAFVLPIFGAPPATITGQFSVCLGIPLCFDLLFLFILCLCFFSFNIAARGAGGGKQGLRLRSKAKKLWHSEELD
jgi:hypothetical protein